MNKNILICFCWVGILIILVFILSFSSTPHVKLSNETDFSLIVFPDTQYSSKKNPSTFDIQSRWIVESKEKLNIVFVTHEGDVVDDYKLIDQWDNAHRSMGFLDGKIPYAISVGNHDYTDLDSRDIIDYNKYFPISRYENEDWWGGNKLENTYQYFNVGELEFMIMHLEFCPRDSTLDWAKQIVRENQDKRVIITTHLYMYNEGARYKEGDFASCGDSGNNGEEQWDKFIKNHKNIFLVLSGHDPNIKGVSYLKSLGNNGNEVHQILANYQGVGDGTTGYLRIMTFSPSQNKIFVKTYSPTKERFDSSVDNEFTLDYNMGEVNK